MFKTDYITRATRFFNSIKDDIQYCYDVEDYEKYFKYYNAARKRAVKIANGCARVAIITSDYVIKIDCGDPDYYGGCEDEIRAYECAKMNGVEGVFAPITKIAPNVYVMPRCKCNDYTRFKKKIYCNIEQFYSGLSKEEREFVRYYINDIHNGNIGKWHKRIVLVDYAANDCR